MSKDYEHYKELYETGMWSKKWLRNITKKGRLTPEEYEAITGEAYD